MSDPLPGFAKASAIDFWNEDSKSVSLFHSEIDTIDKVHGLFCEIQNSGVFGSSKEERDPSDRIFWPMFQSEMQSNRRADQKRILSYLLSSDVDRKKWLEAVSLEEAKSVIFEADLWQIPDLVSRCDWLLASKVVLTEEELSSLSKLNLLSFPLLNAWVFLYGALRIDPKESCGEIIENARRWIDFEIARIKRLDLTLLNLDFLVTVDPIYAPRVVFTVNSSFINDENIKQIFTIAKNFQSHSIMRACLQYENPSVCVRESVGNELLINMKTAFKINQVFKPAPLECNGTGVFLDSEEIDPKELVSDEVKNRLEEIVSLLLKKRGLLLGLSLRVDLLSTFAGLVKNRFLPSLKLLHFIPVKGEFSFRDAEVKSIVDSSPNLETVVIPEKIKDFFSDLPPHVTYFKNLCGRIERVQCGTKRSDFDEIWKKFPILYSNEELPINQ
ncbi:MAG: hypothetical protein WD595_00950 [Waddliaceae bacterium]